MLGVVVVFFLCWALLWFAAREHISVLGIVPSFQRLKEFSLGLIVMAVFCAINLLGQSYFKGTNYMLNPEYSFIDCLQGLWWTFKAAFFEELIFRGSILYLLLKRLGVVKACIIGGIAFGIYHLFSYDMIGGRIIPIIYVFLLTGASGWMFSYAFAKTKSLYTPLGLHLGWILMSIIVFSAGPLGNQLLLLRGEEIELGGWATLLFFIWQAVVVPFLITFYFSKRYESTEREYDD